MQNLSVTLQETGPVYVAEVGTPAPTVPVLIDQTAEGGAEPVELPLTVETSGQTQYNIFALPPATHHLLINGVEHRPPAYTLALVGGNARLLWAGGFALSPDDEVIFVTF